MGVLIFVGIGLMAFFPALVTIPFDGQKLLDRVDASADLQSQIGWLGLIGLPAFAGGTAALVFMQQKRFQSAMISFSAVAVVTVIGLWNIAAPWLDQFQGSQILVEAVRQSADTETEALATYDFFRPSSVFYNRGPIRKCYSIEQLSDFYSAQPDGLILLDASRWEKLQAEAPFQFEISARRARFPEKGELLILTRGDNQTSRRWSQLPD